MALSRNEEMIFREVEALAGDLGQVADNLQRDHKERLKDAEEEANRLRSTVPGVPSPGMPMRDFDKVGLIRDLGYIRTRFNSLITYVQDLK